MVPVHERLTSSLLRDFVRARKRQATASGAFKRTTTVPLHSVCKCHEGEGPVAQSKARPQVSGNAPNVGFQVISLPSAEAAALAEYERLHTNKPCHGCGTLLSLYWWSAADVIEACAAAVQEAGGGTVPTVGELGGSEVHYCHSCYWQRRDAVADEAEAATQAAPAAPDSAMAVDTAV